MTFKKGQSGNPGGRPKQAETLTSSIRRLLRSQKSRDEVAAKLLAMALAGNVEAMKIILDRMDGKVPQPVEGGDPTRPIPIAIRSLTAVPPEAPNARD